MSQQSHQPSLLNRIARVLLCLHNGDHGSSESRPGRNEERPVGCRVPCPESGAVPQL
jgi:hypothetical protein